MPEQAALLLSEWSWDPSIVLGAALVIGAYLGALGPFRPQPKSSTPVARAQVIWFLSGVLVIVFALVSPLDAIGDEYLFSAHMLQHTLLMVIAPPMLLLGTPGWMLRPWLRHPAIRRAAQAVTLPPVAFLVFNVDLLMWHIPVLYEAALENDTIHIIEHLSFIATAVVNWWPLLSPLDELPRLPFVSRIIYLLLDMVPSMALGWFFASAATVIYPTYAAAPHVFALYGLNDQFIGGVMMEMPMGLIYIWALGNGRS